MKRLRINIICAICIITGYSLSLTEDENAHQSRLYSEGIKYVCEIGPDGKIITDGHNINADTYLKRQDQIAIDSTQLYNLSITSDSEMTMLWIFQPHNHVLYLSEYAHEYSINLPPDSYDFMTYIRVSKHHFRYIYKKNVQLESDTTIHISNDEANISSKFMFYREDYVPLRINSFLFRFMLDPVSSLGVSFHHLNLDSTSFVLHYNDLPDYFYNSWLIKGKQDWNNGNIYLINNYLYESNRDTLFTNDPTNFSYADITYQFPDSITNTLPRTQIGTTAPAYHYYLNDRDYTIPFTFKIYQDTSAEFSLAESRFSQTVNVTSTIGTEIKTSEMRIGKQKIYGYISPEEYSKPIILSESKSIQLSMPPTYWAGRFTNSEDSIKMGLDYGYLKRKQLFLSMTNDVIIQPYSKITIRSGDETVIEDLLNPIYKDELCYGGYRPTDLIFNVSGRQSYDVVVSNLHSEVAHLPATSVIHSHFDLSNDDKNPPYLRSFQILSDLQITNILANEKNNTIRFIANDDNQIEEVSLSYSKYEDTLWVELLLEYNPPYYQCEVPELESGYYSLKTYICDPSQNWIENIMEPAFHIGEVTGISSDNLVIIDSDLSISDGYPNPFNATVNFDYSIPIGFTNKIDISIYDVLGKRVCTLLSDLNEPGSHRIQWEGNDTNNRAVSSGIYFIQLKGGGHQLIRKVLLIR